MEELNNKSDLFSLESDIKMFRARIEAQTRDIYEALPEVTGMHFTQTDQVSSIDNDGFVSKEAYPNFAYIFNKKETDEFYKNDLERADQIGLPHYTALESLKRFHKTFIEGFKKYGLEGIMSKNITTGSVRDYLTENFNKLPAVVFADLSDAQATPKGKTKERLSPAYFNGLESEKILTSITITNDDIDDIVKDTEHGITLENSLQKILIDKTIQWLLICVEQKQMNENRTKVEESKDEDLFLEWEKPYEERTMKNLLSEWRKIYDDELGAEVVNKVISRIREMADPQADDKKTIREIAGVEYLTPSALGYARVYISQARSKVEFSKALELLSEEERKITNLLPVHSHGGNELVMLSKSKIAEYAKAQANTKYGRPAESLIYFGSADDLELALLTGSENIYMVDPGLDDGQVDLIIKRVEHYGKNIAYDKNERKLSFDLESRSVLARMFQKSMQDFNLQDQIKAEEVIMFNKHPDMRTEEAKKAMIEGGICIDNKSDQVVQS